MPDAPPDPLGPPDPPDPTNPPSPPGPPGPLAPGQSGDDILASDVRRFPAPDWISRLSRLNSPDWRLSRGAAALGIIGLLAGLAVGYAAGHRQPGQARPAPRPQGSAAPGPAVPTAGSAGSAASVASAAQSVFGLSLTQTTAECSVQHGRELQLGVEIMNPSGEEVTLRHVDPVLPLGGLRALSQQWGPCGVLPQGQDQTGVELLPPGASTWLTVTFKVLVRCPGPLPVQFTVDFDWNGQPAAAILPGFPDLSGVPYAGCG